MICTCTVCKEEKTREEFFNSSLPRGYSFRCKACYKIYSVKNKERLTNYQRVYKYGVTSEKYNIILEEQNGVCAICDEICTTRRSLAIDHNHTTNKVRGLLCAGCNTGIGNFKENTETMYKAIKYLEKHNE